READVPVLVSSTLPELMPDASALSLQADGLPAVAGLAAGLRCAAALAADPGVGRVLVFYDEPAGMDEVTAASWAGVLDAVRAAGRGADVPVLVSSTLPELLPDASALSLQADGLPAVAGLAAGLRCAAALGTPAAEPERIAAVGRAARRAAARGHPNGVPSAADGWLAEHEAKAMLAVAGLPVASGLLASTEDEAAAALGSLGGPVALKVSRPGLRHKSELGAVVLDVADPEAARAAARRLRAVAGDNGATLLVERMAAPGVELLVGARADAIVPVLALGLGGVWTEALDDVVLVPLPATPARVERALRSLRGAPVLLGARGRPADLAAAARLAAAAGDLLLRRGLALLELNPVIVHAHGATVVDALARTPTPLPQGAAA
ncbi:MAG TPA: acetate--CoA ligase family protein, partial [Solirubrobacteraceae bacterium]